MRSYSLLLVPFLSVALCAGADHAHKPEAKAVAAPVAAAAAHATPTVAAPGAAADHAAGGEPAAQGLDARAAVERLLQGNQRFVSDLMTKGHKDGDRRIAVAKGQHPIAIVVCCSDSRVPPEQVFDVGLGDIFVIRVAGNVVDAIGLGSIEYAAAHLHVPLVVVLGHERCGAVTAAISGDAAPAHVLAITDMIQRHLVGTTPEPGDVVDQAVCINAKAVARQIASSAPMLKDMVAAGTLTVIAARYDLDDGVVKVLP
jgi:carbonic anhydrase